MSLLLLFQQNLQPQPTSPVAFRKTLASFGTAVGTRQIVDLGGVTKMPIIPAVPQPERRPAAQP
jgi:hypothetical protein